MADLSPVLKQATPVVATRGEGVYLYDEDDRRYLDFTAGIGVRALGTATRASWRPPRSRSASSSTASTRPSCTSRC